MTRRRIVLRLRSGRSVAAVVIYLAGFVALLLIVSHYYLLPAMNASRSADPETRKIMSAHAMLIMMVMLFILLMGLLMTFQVGRFFRPRQSTPTKPTAYVDAWKESGRRLQVPDEEEEAGG